MITGSIVALVTPMHEDGSIDWESMDNLVDWHIKSGTNGIVPVGTTGESATVDIPEHCEIVKRVVKAVDGRVPVIAGTGANATSEAIELSLAAQNAGADACLLVTPYYNKPTQEGLYLHYKAIAKAVNIPQILYNVPGRTACDLLPETVARLAEIDGIIGIKEATGIMERCTEILALCGDKMVVYSGDDLTALDLILHGALGTISVTANVAPDKVSQVCELGKAAFATMKISGQEGRAQEMVAAARLLDSELVGLHTNLFLESNPIPVKWAVQRMGKIGSGIRLPMTQLSTKFQEPVLTAMRQAGVNV
ncbi:MAG: 4-hydroxy-tetrahydrodipicolinate synthase [Candidatus Azotimanducaceae bacterium]|jgi:4-hydroxy-tetrahydrodipicolinate synthase